jgi:hypothetical protein
MTAIIIRVSSFENRTTRTGLKLAARGADIPSTQFLCFLEKGMILELPPRTCAKGHKIQLVLEVKFGKKELHFEASAVVSEVISSPGERDSVTLGLVGYEVPDWNWIQGIYQTRQADITALFTKLKGN